MMAACSTCVFGMLVVDLAIGSTRHDAQMCAWRRIHRRNCLDASRDKARPMR
jgi:hypothetical protein